MPLPPQLDIYKASAGSGKTFLLTLQYLQLALEQPDSYRHILAVTFTNKATAEMKTRILTELENLARGEETIYGSMLLDRMPGKTYETLQEDARQVYSAILHDYGRFYISTIDSFVQRIIRSFAFEIGIDSGFRIKLNTDTVKEDLAEKLFRLLDTDEALRNWVAELATRRLSEGKSWNFREDMLSMAEELFKEPFQDFEAALKALPDVDASFKAFREKIFAVLGDFEKRWKETGNEALRLLEANQLNSMDFYYGKGGFINYFTKAEDGVVERYGSRVRDVLDDPSKMPGKNSKEAVAPVQDQLYRLLKKLCDQCDQEFELYNTALVLSRNVGNLRLMQVFSEQLGAYRSEHNVLLSSDTNLLLRQLTRETDASFIYEKTGNRFRHFLIDEFQDTSGFQWDNFKPLLENTLAEGNYNLVVGDVKQAIYRWRSGNWQLLHSKVKEHLSHLTVAIHSLQDNRRSARPVIQFNNFLFKAAPLLLQEELNTLMSNAPASIREQLVRDGFHQIIETAYAESLQQIPEKASGNGLVDISFLDCSETDYGELMLPKLFEQVVGLLAEGFMPRDIAILTRKNGEAATIIEYLTDAQQERGIYFDLVSSDALQLKNNYAVRLIVQAMQVLAGNGGKLALVNLRQLVVQLRGLQVSDFHIYINKEDQEVILPPAFYLEKERLKREPLPEMVSQVISIFGLHQNRDDSAYLLAFQDLLAEWTRFENDGLLDFLHYWEDEGSKTSLPGGSGANAVEVLTIHKSKGLAYNVLLIPYLNWPVKPEATKNIQVWVDTRSTPFNHVPLVPVRFSSQLAESAFAYSYFEEMLLGMMDNLNMLYVATTRVRRRLIGWAPLRKTNASKDSINTIDQLLLKATRHTWPETISADQSGISFTVDDAALLQKGFDEAEMRWRFGADELAPEPQVEEKFSLLPMNVQSEWKNRLTVRYQPLTTEETEDAQLPRKLGVLMHEALALLHRPFGLEKAIVQMKQRGLIAPSQVNHVKTTIEQIIDLPLMSGWRDGTMQRLGERDIIAGKDQFRRPDLVLYNREKTLVIDFKFTDDRSLDEKYRFQVSDYIRLLKQTGFENIEGYLLYAGEKIELVPVLIQGRTNI